MKKARFEILFRLREPTKQLRIFFDRLIILYDDEIRN